MPMKKGSDHERAYFLRLEVEEEYGKAVWKKFRASYRFAKERCCNPNCKDFQHYQGKWNIEDVFEYFEIAFPAFLEGLSKYPLNKLSIDRIDSNKPYQRGNIRFTTMAENLRNKEVCRPVRLTNIETGETVNFTGRYAISHPEPPEERDMRFSSTGVMNAYEANRLFKRVWQVELL